MMRCTLCKRYAMIPISESPLRFRTSIVILSQVDRTVKISSGQGIAVTDQHDNEYTITDVVDRDEAFTQIVGYSKVKWQVVG